MSEHTFKCCACKETKPHTDFSRDIRRPSGLSSYCKLCNHTKVIAYKLANPEKEKLRQQVYRQRTAQVRGERARARYAAAHPSVLYKRTNKTFRADQLQEAIDYVRANPNPTRAAIMREVGLTEYGWKLMRDEFIQNTVATTRNSSIKCTYSLRTQLQDDIIDTQPKEIYDEIERSIPRFEQLSSVAVQQGEDAGTPKVRALGSLVAPKPVVTISRAIVSSFSSEYDD